MPINYTTDLISISVGVAPYFGNALILDTTNSSPASLEYYVIDTDGTENLSYDPGTVLFYFAPDWASVSQGGTGPGETAYFLMAGDGGTNGLFEIYTDAYGSNIYFGGVSNGVPTNRKQGESAFPGHYPPWILHFRYSCGTRFGLFWRFYAGVSILGE